MISRKEALRITASSFPNGPEELAKRLDVEFFASPMVGVEGWCIRGVRSVIRVNSSSSKSRQRFTLSHELAHLVLGTEPDIATEPFRSDRSEERDADQLASEILIPDVELARHLGAQLPIDAKSLKRLSNIAKVSPVMAACRVVSATQQLGLQNAAVVFFIAVVNSGGTRMACNLTKVLHAPCCGMRENACQASFARRNTTEALSWDPSSTHRSIRFF